MSVPDKHQTAEPPLSVAQCSTLACLLEVTAPKVGNVYRGADFDDLSFADFLISSAAVLPCWETLDVCSVGETILRGVAATRAAVGTNTNLGMLLLLAPLAHAAHRWQGPRKPELLQAATQAVLDQLTPADAGDVYRAIAMAEAGGLGRVEEADLHGDPPDDLVAAMRLAAGRDRVAQQYAAGFSDVFTAAVPGLVAELSVGHALGEAIVGLQLRLLARFPDSLIARKCGPQVAREASDRAAHVRRQTGNAAAAARAEFDFWLRSDGHRRNPGTTADLVTAGLFVALWCGLIPPPYRFDGASGHTASSTKAPPATDRQQEYQQGE